MQSAIINFLAFIFIFGLIVIVHEFGHFYFAKKAGILVREFAIGMGPKIFAHIGKDGTAYTIRILPVGGYVRMAGWGDDETEIKTGQAVTLTLDEAGLVKRINLSQKQLDMTSLPMNVTHFDFEEKLEITGLVLDATKTYKVDHDATIIEEDGTEVRIAPLDVQYQNASVLGRMMTNFAGPMNNFILGILTFVLLAFLQGGVPDTSSNRVTVMDGGAAKVAGLKTGDAITHINDKAIKNWTELTTTIAEETAGQSTSDTVTLTVTYERDGKTQNITVSPKAENGQYYIGVSPVLKTGLADKLWGGLATAWDGAFTILNGLRNLITRPSLDQLGGPVAIFQVSSQAVKRGWESILNLLALLSINLGIVNLIPIPVLDGGKIVINIIEWIRRKPLKKEVEGIVTMVGVVFMVLLMIAVTWNDIMRAFF